MRQIKRSNNISISCLLSLVACLLLLIAVPTFAAEIFFEPQRNAAAKDQFVMDVFLTTENTNEYINAVEGVIRFPSDLLELKNINEGNSIITVWLEKPRIRVDSCGEMKNSCEFTFSGITPGGYTGNKGLLFSMTFLIRKEGEGVFEIDNARALLNDGEGTEAHLRVFPARFFVSKKDPIIELPIAEIKDTTPPEPFAPYIAHDPNIFEEKWFLVFATQDKGSGIDRYEIKETRHRIQGIWKQWVRAESPYVLRDQELKSSIFVKALDKNGNERIIKVLAQNPFRWYENYENWIIILIGVFSIQYVVYRTWQIRRYNR